MLSPFSQIMQTINRNLWLCHKVFIVPQHAAQVMVEDAGKDVAERWSNSYHLNKQLLNKQLFRNINQVQVACSFSIKIKTLLVNKHSSFKQRITAHTV